MKYCVFQNKNTIYDINRMVDIINCIFILEETIFQWFKLIHCSIFVSFFIDAIYVTEYINNTITYIHMIYSSTYNNSLRLIVTNRRFSIHVLQRKIPNGSINNNPSTTANTLLCGWRFQLAEKLHLCVAKKCFLCTGDSWWTTNK